MNYKMAVFDMDDTLMLPDGTLHLDSKNDIIKIQKMGIKVVLATGRPTFGVLETAKELELYKYGGYILPFNGSKIIKCDTNEVLYDKYLSKSQVERLYDLSKKHECFIHTYTEDKIIANADNPYTYIESEVTGMGLEIHEDFLAYIPEKCTKVTMLQQPKHIKEVEKMLKNKVDDMYMTTTKPFFLEFMDKNVDKGSSIVKLCDTININIKDVIAIGDSYNDITMIKAAGFGIAMENAVDELKEIAQAITDTNANNGVSNAIRKYIL